MLRSFAAVVVVLLSACSGTRSTPASPGGGTATVLRNVDGDTVDVDIDGVEESIRLIGIDTPETVSPSRPVECFGPEASARANELLPAGTVVRLERDVEARDRYGRLLAYVYRDRDGTLVNLLLVEEGYAAASPFPPNTVHQAAFDRAEAEAKANGRGLWPVCGGTDTPVGPPPG